MCPLSQLGSMDSNRDNHAHGNPAVVARRYHVGSGRAPPISRESMDWSKTNRYRRLCERLYMNVGVANSLIVCSKDGAARALLRQTRVGTA